MEQADVRHSPPKALGPVTISRRYAAVVGLCPAPRWGAAPDPAEPDALLPPIPSASYMRPVLVFILHPSQPVATAAATRTFYQSVTRCAATLARGASMLSPSPFSPTAHPAKGSKVQAFDSGDVDAGVGQLFVVDLSALRMAAVNKLWKDARLRVCLDAKWSVNLFPLCYAVWAPGAHDSGLGGATAQYACCVKT